MWKALLAGTAAIAIAGTSLVYAQQRDDNAPARWRGHSADRPASRGLSQEDRAAFTDARIAALKAGLRLSPEQEKLWPAFETAMRDIAKERLEHRADRPNEARPSDPVERLRRRADALSAAGANLKRLADAQEPLYQSLDDSQKNRFQLLSRILSSHGPYHSQMRGRDGRGSRGDHHRRGRSGREGGPGEQL